MAERKSTKKTAQKSAKSATATSKTSKGWTPRNEPRRRRTPKNSRRRRAARMTKGPRWRRSPRCRNQMAERLHAIIKASAPDLSPKTWYGMPAYAKEGKVVCFFESAQKFKTRYATLGFSDKANLDEGAMWPTAFALTELTADEARIAALVKQAVS